MGVALIGILLLSVFALIGVGVALYAVIIYNGLVSLKHNIDKTWSNIDVLLKQRWDEIPKLVKVCEGYMKHERETLEAVARARNMAGGARTEKEAFAAQDTVSNALKSLFALSERYPDLKADAMFRQLQSRISELEDHIADRRELFNESVNLYNIRIEQFPDVLLARLFGFGKRELWKIEPQERGNVSAEVSRA